VSLRGVITPGTVGVMTPKHSIPEGSSVSYTDEEGGEWAAVVLQHLPNGKYDIRLTEARGKKVIATEDELEAW
jgi:hypothetical protein